MKIINISILDIRLIKTFYLKYSNYRRTTMTCANDPMKDLEQALKNFKGKYYIPNDDDGIDYKQR